MRRYPLRALFRTPAPLLLVLGALLAAPPASRATARQNGGPGSTAQGTQTPQEPVGEYSESLSVAWVLVPVTVRSPRGYVTDLERRDFRLFVDDRRVDFPDFESGREAPVSLVYLQDLSGSMANGGKLAASRRALGYLLDQARPSDETALASFAGKRLQVDVPFTGDEQALREAMGLWEGYGTTALHDAVGWIPRISAEGRHPKRAVVLVSDGVDNASVLSPETARQVVEEARLPVYVLGIGRDQPPPLADDDGVAPAADDTYARLLQRLARATGGRYFPVRRPKEVAGAAAQILEELRQQYVLAFPATPGPVAPRRLRVEVAVPGRVAVYHRRGYLGGPPA